MRADGRKKCGQVRLSGRTGKRFVPLALLLHVKTRARSLQRRQEVRRALEPEERDQPQGRCGPALFTLKALT